MYFSVSKILLIVGSIYVAKSVDDGERGKVQKIKETIKKGQDAQHQL